jgi:SAM-dependent methyltransferase
MNRTAESNIGATKRYFNRKRSDQALAASPVQQFVFDSIQALIPSGDSSRTAIDLGCHWGRYTVRLAQTFGRVVGFDFAEEAVASAMPHPRVEYRVADLDEHPEFVRESGPAHFFLAVGLFEMLPRPSRLLKALADASAPGGELLIVIPNPRSWNVWIFRLLFRVRSWIRRNAPTQLFYNRIPPEELASLVKGAGFVIESEGYTVGIPVYLLDLMPTRVQRRVIAQADKSPREGGGAYYWLRARRP